MSQLFHGDCLAVLPTLEADSIDSCVTDPPYEYGFMGKSWDSSGVAFQADTWRAVYRVLKPGAHLVAFGSSRTYHRLACAVEDAGFEVRDCIAWINSQGMPKSLNIAKEIDRKLGVKPTVIGQEKNFGAHKQDEKNAYGDFPGVWNVTEPTSAQAIGWRGWGTGLKPCLEPILLARKPLPNTRLTIAENVLQHGTGALNIDATRIPHADAKDLADHDKSVRDLKARYPDSTMAGNWKNNSPIGGANDVTDKGRWTPNVAIDSVVARELGEFARYYYCPKAGKSDRGEKNTHPTVKPTKLLEWLATLINPPCGTILDPFMGSGSTGVVAKRLGFGFVGIELLDTKAEPYFTIAKRRIDNARRNPGVQPSFNKKQIAAWQKLLEGLQVRNEEDLLRCYRYWKGYQESPGNNKQTKREEKHNESEAG